jgi:hypothetical protein
MRGNYLFLKQIVNWSYYKLSSNNTDTTSNITTAASVAATININLWVLEKKNSSAIIYKHRGKDVLRELSLCDLYTK